MSEEIPKAGGKGADGGETRMKEITAHLLSSRFGVDFEIKIGAGWGQLVNRDSTPAYNLAKKE